MKKSIFLFFAAILCAIGMNAATPTKIYLNAQSWGYSDARYAAYFFDPAKWVDMKKVDGETFIYEVDVPAGYTKVIFVRMNGSQPVNDWANKWNQTGNLNIPTNGKNMFKPSGWNGVTTTWSTYTPTVTHTFAKNSTLYVDFRAITDKKGANYPKAGSVGIDYSANAGGTVIPVTFTADVKWAEGTEFIKTEKGEWTSIPFKAPAAGQNCAQVAADGKSYTWTTFSEPSVTLSLDKTEADAGTEVTVTLTATADNVSGEVTYAFQYSTDNATWNNITATDNTATQTFAAETRYYKVTMTNGGTTKEATAKFSAIKFHIIGSWDNWTAHNEVVEGSKTITLEANKTYEYKITNGTWDLSWGNNGTMTRENCTNWSFEASGNAKITTDEAGDYVFNVSRNAEGKVVVSVTYPELVTPIPTYDYYIAGNMNDWNPKHPTYGMTDEDADGIYEKEITLAAGQDHQFKVTNGKWGNETDGFDCATVEGAYEEVDSKDGNVLVKLNAETTFTVKFDKNAKEISFEGLTEKVIEYGVTFNVTVPEGTPACYICGAWDWKTFKPMTKVDDTHYTLEIAEATKDHGYKYTCGEGWEFVEKDAEGNDLEVDRTWSENDVVASWAAPAEPVEMASVVLLGVEGDWTTGIEMELNPTDANEYMLLCQSITADEPIKIKAVDTQATVTWCAKLADTSLGTVVKDADGNDNIVLEEGKYDFYYKVAEKEVWIGTCTETEPEYNVVEDEITNFVFDTEAWPMVCMGGPSTTYQVEVFLTLTEDADGTLAYEDCSVSIMGTDATFIDGTLSNIDVYAPSADAVLHVLWQEEYYELKLSMSAVSSAAPVDVMAADATVTFSDNEGALKFNGTNVYDDDAVYVELAGFEYNGAGEYTLNGAQISMFENTDAFAFADEVTVAIDEDGYVTVEGVYTSFNGGGIYNVRIWGALPKYTLTLSSDVSDATLTGSDTYYATQEVTVTATQELPGWVFDHWSDGDEKVSTDATYTFRIGKDLELTANYLEIYTRTVTSGSYGTICLPNGSVKVEGAKFYEVTFKKDGYIYADEVTELAAGMPYIFHATSTEVKVYYNETTATAGSKNGVYGTFSDITDGDAGTTGNVLEGKYLLVAGPKVQKCAGNCSLAANRAYFVVSEITTNETQPLPGRKRIALGCQEENQATGLDNITENGTIAPAMQGTYDILGRQLSEPAANGFYIINGKKMFVVK